MRSHSVGPGRRLLTGMIAGVTAFGLGWAITPIATAAPQRTMSPAAISHDDLEHFMAGVGGYQNRMSGLDRAFGASVTQLQGYANDMVPLIGSEDPNDKAQLDLLVGAAAMAGGSLRQWATATQPSYERATARFLKMYLPAWSTPKEKAALRSGVARLKAAFVSHFQTDVPLLADAAVALSNEDLEGFAVKVAAAIRSQHDTAEASTRAVRSLLNMG